MIERSQRKLAQREEQRKLLKDARRAKLRRHKAERGERERTLGDDARLQKQHAQQRAQEWLEEVYAIDADLTVRAETHVQTRSPT
jgi:hypothetical protein